MSKMTALFVVISLMWLALDAAPSAAQGYQPPAGSPISPYLNLFRRDVGVLNNYYNYLVPQSQLDNALRLQAASINSLQGDVQRVRGELQRAEEEVGIRSTGVGGGFMFYSHYYDTQYRAQIANTLQQYQGRRAATTARSSRLARP
jgi:hypothetical protein